VFLFIGADCWIDILYSKYFCSCEGGYTLLVDGLCLKVVSIHWPRSRLLKHPPSVVAKIFSNLRPGCYFEFQDPSCLEIHQQQFSRNVPRRIPNLLFVCGRETRPALDEWQGLSEGLTLDRPNFLAHIHSKKYKANTQYRCV
jgi:hypothetical protein